MLNKLPIPELSSNLFTADERCVLQGWFRNRADPATTRILAGWDLDVPPVPFSALDVAVAVVLERVQLRHPRLGAVVAPERNTDGVSFAINLKQSERDSGLVLPLAPLTRHLFSVRWRDQRATGLFCPSCYSATPLPGTDKVILAISDDRDNSSPVAHDVAIGWVSAEANGAEAIGAGIRREWSSLRDELDCPRWDEISRPGLFDPALLTAWADTVWR